MSRVDPPTDPGRRTLRAALALLTLSSVGCTPAGPALGVATEDFDYVVLEDGSIWKVQDGVTATVVNVGAWPDPVSQVVLGASCQTTAVCVPCGA